MTLKQKISSFLLKLLKIREEIADYTVITQVLLRFSSVLMLLTHQRHYCPLLFLLKSEDEHRKSQLFYCLYHDNNHNNHNNFIKR